MDKKIALKDIVLEDMNSLHIKAVGSVACKNPSYEYKNVNVNIDFLNMKNPMLNIDVWYKETITGETVTKKKVTITFEDYDLNFSLDKERDNILTCLWKASRNKKEKVTI